MTVLHRPVLDSDAEYALRLGDQAFWEPYARRALERAGLPTPSSMWIAQEVGTYPTLLTDTGLVVKLFGQRYYGPESHAAERDAYRVLAGYPLPAPGLVAAGALFSDADGWPWPFLVVTQVHGVSYASQQASLSPSDRLLVARELGGFLRQLHALPLVGMDALRPDWDRCLALLARRRRDAPADYRRWGILPPHLVDQLDGWLPDPLALVDTRRPPRFLHGDIHSQHVFLDPVTHALSAVIDFTDALAGDPRYDLVALHFGTFRTDKALLIACLDGCGWPVPDDDWPRQMLAFTLLHDFNMLTPNMDLARYRALDDLADAIWRLDTPSLGRRA
jgi:hygromycin-B 7''-O-kinase